MEDLAASVITEIELRGEIEARDVPSEARNADILASITDAFFALDQEWRFTYINPQAEHLLQSSKDELLGACLWDRFPETLDYELYHKYHEVGPDAAAGRLRRISGPTQQVDRYARLSNTRGTWQSI